MFEIKIFDFHFIYHGTNGINKFIEFTCPICNKNVKALGLDDYIPFHDFYENIEFFCSNCLSQFITYKDSKIKLKSKALII